MTEEQTRRQYQQMSGRGQNPGRGKGRQNFGQSKKFQSSKKQDIKFIPMEDKERMLV